MKKILTSFNKCYSVKLVVRCTLKSYSPQNVTELIYVLWDILGDKSGLILVVPIKYGKF